MKLAFNCDSIHPNRMIFDWNLAWDIAVPLTAAAAGALFSRWLERKPRLLAWYGHTSAFRVNREKPYTIHTHSVVIWNGGNRAANNLRLSHRYLPDFTIEPDVAVRREKLAGGGEDIIIERLVPKAQLTVSYLYFPPNVWSNINTIISSDDGLAKVLDVVPSPRLANWQVLGMRFLMFFGVAALVYLAAQTIQLALT